jgi:hypothetical protein
VAKTDHGRRRATYVEIIDEDGVKQTIKAKKGVVVACGTIASSLLLDRSDVDNTGKGISLNIASPIPCLMPEGMSPAWDEDQMATMVDCGDFLLESHFQPPMSMASLMPGWFGDMDKGCAPTAGSARQACCSPATGAGISRAASWTSSLRNGTAPCCAAPPPR